MRSPAAPPARTFWTQHAGPGGPFSVNGLSTTAGDSRSAAIAPGLTVDLLDTGTTTIMVTRDTSGIRSAIDSLVKTFNTAVGELDTHRGNSVGALGGQSIVRTLADTLRAIGSYDGGSGTFGSLTDLGLTFDKDGRLQFDSAAFEEAAKGKVDDVLAFLGGTGTGGFLKTANDILDGVEDSTTGILKTTLSTIQEQKTAQDKLLESEQARIDQFEANLRERLAVSDALIASLEQQASYFTTCSPPCGTPTTHEPHRTDPDEGERLEAALEAGAHALARERIGRIRQIAEESLPHLPASEARDLAGYAAGLMQRLGRKSAARRERLATELGALARPPNTATPARPSATPGNCTAEAALIPAVQSADI